MSILETLLAKIDKTTLYPDTLFQRDGLRIVALCQLHCLPSTVRLIVRLCSTDIGINPRHIIFVPKSYSTISPSRLELEHLGVQLVDHTERFQPGCYDQSVKNSLVKACHLAGSTCAELAAQGSRVRLVIIDDGGLLTEAWWTQWPTPRQASVFDVAGSERTFSPIETVSVQQTTSGIRRLPHPSQIPKIDISRSAAKRYFESRIIAEGVLSKVRELDLLQEGDPVGVIGVGALGTALAEDLFQQRAEVFVYDIRKRYRLPKGSNKCRTLRTLLSQCRIVFGCAGEDIIDPCILDTLNINSNSITFISCSSRDIEFRRMLRYKGISNGIYARIAIKTQKGTHYVENGGFPINFDRVKELKSPDEIALTRALVFAGVLQALCLDCTRLPAGVIRLSPGAQQYIVRSWMEARNETPEKFGVSESAFGNPRWWRTNSYGACAQKPSTIVEQAVTFFGRLKDRFLSVRSIAQR